MFEKYAVRTVRLCTKDCLCLYVCPSGATDTENSVIDVTKCTGCGVCAAACPSGAISLMPVAIPPQQKHEEVVVAALKTLMRSKSQQEGIAAKLSGTLALAIEKSNRIMAEDIIREAGYMLPQSGNSRAFLAELLTKQLGEAFPKEAVVKLLAMLTTNEDANKDFNEDSNEDITKGEAKPESKPERWKCTVCGYIHEGPLPADFTCPRCKQPASVFVKLED